ncbi:MAG: hypothetical protein KatS3mg111_2838 [Pirellulaceae bacterium]|nr:MAG: hypothetical protein KatS3mg111_2838 [Pirellulaceae bacterium]
MRFRMPRFVAIDLLRNPCRASDLAAVRRYVLPACWLMVIGCLMAAAHGQQTEARPDPAATAATDSPILDDLLDLLADPEPTPTSSAPSPTSPASQSPGTSWDGEDIGQRRTNPLEPIQQSMLVAAERLHRGAADESTRQLQRDIIMRLDELIEQLEQSSREQQRQQQMAAEAEREDSSPSSEPQSEPPTEEQRNASSRDSSSSAGENDGQMQQEPSASSSANGESSDSETQESSEEESPDSSGEPATPGSRPGVAGEPLPLKVDLADPKALQQGVWGRLPEQVRQQMQSRMVEEFHPVFRQQIEAYYQALMQLRP